MAHILIFDPEPRIPRLMEAVLLPGGHSVTATSEPRDVLSLIEREQPDLVILDRGGSDGVGFEIEENLRLEPATRHLPVILMLAKSPRFDDWSRQLNPAIAAGRTYLTKPFGRVELLHGVDLALRPANEESN